MPTLELSLNSIYYILIVFLVVVIALQLNPRPVKENATARKP